MIRPRHVIAFVGASVAIFVIASVFVTARQGLRFQFQKNAGRRNVLRVLSMSGDSVRKDVADANIQVDGDDDYRLQISRALAIIKHNCPTNYAIITNNIRAVRPGPYTWVYPNVNPVVCVVETNHIAYSATWAAEILIRFGLHADRYRKFHEQYPAVTVPYSAWTNWKQQKKCFADTLAVLLQLGAPDQEIDSLKRYFETWYPEKQQDAPEPPAPQNRTEWKPEEP